MIKSIIFPTDFSENARIAMAYAIEMAEKTHSKLLLFHSYWVPVSNKETPKPMLDEMNQERKTALEKLELIKNDIQKLYQNLEVEFQISNDLFVHALAELIKDSRSHMIVMGTKGEKGLKGVVL